MYTPSVEAMLLGLCTSRTDVHGRYGSPCLKATLVLQTFPPAPSISTAPSVSAVRVGCMTEDSRSDKSCFCHYQCHVDLHLKSTWQPVDNDVVASHALWRGTMRECSTCLNAYCSESSNSRESHIRTLWALGGGCPICSNLGGSVLGRLLPPGWHLSAGWSGCAGACSPASAVAEDWCCCCCCQLSPSWLSALSGLGLHLAVMSTVALASSRLSPEAVSCAWDVLPGTSKGAASPATRDQTH